MQEPGNGEGVVVVEAVVSLCQFVSFSSHIFEGVGWHGFRQILCSNQSHEEMHVHGSSPSHAGQLCSRIVADLGTTPLI